MQQGWTLNMQCAAGTEACAWSTTWKRAARHSCILRVEAVVLPPSAFRTLLQRQLVARAAHLVQPHAVRALAKMCLLPRSRHAAVKTEWESQRPSVCCELNNFHAAQEANCTPLAHKTWLDQVPKTKKICRLAWHAFLRGTWICAGTMNLIHFLESRCSLWPAPLSASGGNACHTSGGRRRQTHTHTRLLFLLRPSVVCCCRGLNKPDGV